MPQNPPLPPDIEVAHLTRLLINAPAFICSLREPNHVIELANEKFFELVGRRDIIGKPLLEAVPEIASQGFIEILDQVYQTGEPFSAPEMPGFIQRADGSLDHRVVNQIYQPVRDRDGVIRGIFIQGVDITAQVRAREAALESERQMRLMADTMPQIVWTARPDGFIDYYNRHWVEYTGMTIEQTQGWGWQPVLHPDDLENCLDRWTESVRTGEDYEVEYRFKRASDGTYRWHLGRALPLRDEAGNISKWFGTCTDIEARRQTEQALETANRLKDEFLATLSHELRTPLNGILGWATLLSENDLDQETTKQGLETIERCARNQARLIEDLLDVSRILSGKMRLQVQTVDLSDCVQSALETMRPAALAKGISLQSEFEAGAHLVSADPERIGQIAWNLLSNAIKFTPKTGSVLVRVRRRDSHIELSVKDTGSGIHADFLPFVFDRFRQADASMTRREGGLGIGLGLVRHLMELHGGTARVESAGASQGSTFTVSFPVLGMISPQKVEENTTADGAATESAAPAAILTGLKILLVDDEEDVRTLVSLLLQKQGAAVEVAACAADAMQKIENCAPPAGFDVLISDVGMPGESGYDLIGGLRRLEAGRGGFLPAIAVTAYARSEDRAQALKAGFQSYLIKPVTPTELIENVATLAGRAAPSEDQGVSATLLPSIDAHLSPFPTVS